MTVRNGSKWIHRYHLKVGHLYNVTHYNSKPVHQGKGHTITVTELTTM